MSAIGSMVSGSWVLMAAYECFWVFMMNAKHCPGAVISAHEWSWCRTHAWSWLLINIHEQAWALIIRANKHSWARCHGTITTHSAFAPYLSVLTSDHECSWGLLSAPEYSRVFLSVQVHDSMINISIVSAAINILKGGVWTWNIPEDATFKVECVPDLKNPSFSKECSKAN